VSQGGDRVVDVGLVAGALNPGAQRQAEVVQHGRCGDGVVGGLGNSRPGRVNAKVEVGIIAGQVIPEVVGGGHVRQVLSALGGLACGVDRPREQPDRFCSNKVM
jgi:hypothetical protein